ncbi:cytochrome P450 726A27-like [Euphorbia lathyris]|uniref:cytochrome P450 726A27-like n=1 Tax=Euphorbia lathyris TaxID=212925 RepID=UPI0033132764
MELLTFFSPLLILVLSTILIIWKKKKPKPQTSNQPPQPPKLPLIGNLHQVICIQPHRRLAELAKIYGPLMQLKLGQASAVVVSSPEIAKQVLKDNDIKVSDRCRVSVADILFYNRQNIGFAPYGEYWRQMRKICILELLSSKRVQSFASIREEEISDFIRLIDSKRGSMINLSEMALSLSNSIAARTVIGWKNKNQEAVVKVINRLLKELGGFTVLDMFPSLEFIHVISGMKSRLVKLHKQADQLLEDIIEEHKAELKLGVQSDANNNILKVLLKLQANPDSLLTTDGIKAITLELFIAGIDSSATILEWVMSELMKNPRIMKNAQEEVRKKVCAKNGKLDESVTSELKFMKAIIKETLRLHPPGPLVPRQCRENCEINGYNINPKTEVLVNVWVIGRDPNYWTEPENFNPERFIESEVDYKGFDFEYIPFGAGRRICPGIQLDITNLELALAKILCYFDWELPNQMKPDEFVEFRHIFREQNRQNRILVFRFFTANTPSVLLVVSGNATSINSHPPLHVLMLMLRGWKLALRIDGTTSPFELLPSGAVNLVYET